MAPALINIVTLEWHVRDASMYNVGNSVSRLWNMPESEHPLITALTGKNRSVAVPHQISAPN